MQYQIRISQSLGAVIIRTDEDGKEWSIPEDPENSDYKQYLVDTDGGLPIPEVGETIGNN